MLRFFKSNLFFFLLLTAIIFLLYGKSISFDFTYRDDNILILEKAAFLTDIKNIPKLFTTSCFYSNDFQYYRPILNLFFLTETICFGINSKIYHFTNIILFILALYLMYVFLCKLSLNKTILKFIVLLMSVHPILTSCAVWIPARNDTLLAIFIFLSFIFFVKYLKNNSVQNLLLYIFFFTIALFTKETAVLNLLLYPMFIYCFDYKFNKKEILKNIVLFVPILIFYFYLRNISVSGDNISTYLTNYIVFFKNTFVGVCVYLHELFVPNNFSIMLYEIKLNIFYMLVFVFCVAFMIMCFYKKIIEKKALLFFLCWFLFFLLPTFLLLCDYVFFNHRIFISLVAFIFILTIFAEYIIVKYPILKKYMAILFVLLFSVNIYYCFIQQNKYENKYTYWVNTYFDAPTYHGACYWLAYLYTEQKNYSKAKEFLEKANEYGDNRYVSDLALIYYYEGNYNKAKELYNESIEFGINKAQCYRNLSVICLKIDNDTNKAIEYARLAVMEEPYDDGYKQYLLNLQKMIDEKNNI